MPQSLCFINLYNANLKDPYVIRCCYCPKHAAAKWNGGAREDDKDLIFFYNLIFI